MALVMTVCYGAAAWNNQFVFDDHTVIETLPAKLTLHDVADFFGQPHYLNFLYYRPITRASLAIQRAVCGLSPRPFHLFNAVLAGLVFIAVYLLLRSRQFGIGTLAAMFAALWLGLHPATSECVYPAASGRESLLPMLFIPLALWAYLRDGWKWYATAMALFIAALLCKEQSAVLPGLFVLADLLWPHDTGATDFSPSFHIPESGKHTTGLQYTAPSKLLDGQQVYQLEYQSKRARRIFAAWRAKILRWIPIALLFAGYFLLRHIIFGRHSIHIDVWRHPWQPLVSLLYGWQTTIAPFVELRYEPPVAVWLSWPRIIVSALVLAALWLVIVRSSRTIKLTAIFWLAWFVLLQLPTAHLVAEQEAPFSERYVALATLAFPAMLAAVAAQLHRRRWREITVTAATFCLAAFGVIAFARGAYYTDELAFNRQWELTNPRSSVAHSGMGLVYEKQGDINSAIAEYNTALDCNPEDWTAHNALGMFLLKGGHYWQAEEHFRFLDPSHSRNPQVMVNYGLAVEMLAIQEKNLGYRNTARRWFEDAIKISPTYADAHFQLGAWYAQFDDPATARHELQTAMALDPNLSQAKAWLDRLSNK